MSNTENAVAAGPRTALFISYSRADSTFVGALDKALRARGYDVRIDRADIQKGEEWWKRIVDLIVDSTLVVFIMSPESIASPVCRDEVDLTKRLGKRIVPLMWRNARGPEIPEGLAERDWVSFEAAGPSGNADEPALAGRPAFAAALDELETAINLDDVLWAREHAQWLKRAMDWDRAGRPEGGVMRAGEITAAQTWANRRPQNAPAVPEVVTEFLNASLAKEERDREELNARERRISAGQQRLVAEAARRAREANRPNIAMRLALAGEPSVDERARGILPEPTRRAELAAAAHVALAVACLTGHDFEVRSAALSPDGVRVVTASDDCTARVWDAETGAELARLSHRLPVRSAAFSPDGTRVVTASEDGTARAWDAASGAELFQLCHNGDVCSAAFSADGARVVTASHRTARVWDAANGAELARLSHDNLVISAVFSADRARVVTASLDKTARVWIAASGTELARLGHDFEVRSAAFSPDGARVVTASDGGTARVWDAVSGAELVSLGHGRGVSSAAFSFDGTRVVTASKDGTARVWDAVSGAELARLGHDNEVRSAAFSPEGARVVTASLDKTARVWDAASGAELFQLCHNGDVCSAAFSADGARVVTASQDRTARVWDAATLYRLNVSQRCKDLALTGAREPRVESLSEDRSEYVRNAAIANLGRFGQTTSVNLVVASADGARVVTASSDGTTTLWAPGSESKPDAAWRMVARLDRGGWVGRATFSADGSRLVTAEGYAARVWDAATGVEVAHLDHDEEVSEVQISPKGNRALTIPRGGSPLLWDPVSGAEVARLNGHDDLIWTAEFSADGASVVTVSNDGTARVWDVPSGVEVARLNHDDLVRSAAFSADAARLVTTTMDETMWVWDVTWATKLRRDALVSAVARTRLVGEGRLTEEELPILRPILGEVDRDVASRWLKPSPDDGEIEAILAQWRRHREMALALAKKDWAARAEEIRADLAARRAAAAGPSPNAPPAAPTMPPPGAAPADVPTAHPQPEPVRPRLASRRHRWLLLALAAVLAVAAARSAGLWP